MGSDNMRLFRTLPHPCGYFPGRTAASVVLDPASASIERDYARALALGFRRAGSQVYRPHCGACRACVPCRIDVAAFRPSRSQVRCLRRNANLDVRECTAGYSAERHALYRRYLQSRHAGGGMDAAHATDFDDFLDAHWSPTRFLECRADGELLAVAVTDVCASGVSAVYSFFDPAQPDRSLGTFSILQQLALAQRLGLPHLYLGFWIAGHAKMDYKRRFAALELLGPEGWRRADA